MSHFSYIYNSLLPSQLVQSSPPSLDNLASIKHYPTNNKDLFIQPLLFNSTAGHAVLDAH